VSNTTPAALFRSVEIWSPTLLIDEADTFMGKADELKGIVNAGHTPSSAFVLRVVGDDHQPRRFNTYCPKALAGINLPKHLPDSTMSRAVVFNLRRKLPHETVERLRHADPKLFEEIASKLARFAMDYTDQVRRARPALPDALNDRDQDNFEPLLAIAECAGSDWVRKATEAALKLSASNADSTGIGNDLLADIQLVYVRKQIGKITTHNLISALCEDEERPWATFNHGKPITPRQLSRLLAPYGIRPKTVRFGNTTPKGYDIYQFEDAFARYLSSPRESAETPQQSAGAQ
jgi:putative DNA primase/helicase